MLLDVLHLSQAVQVNTLNKKTLSLQKISKNASKTPVFHIFFMFHAVYGHHSPQKYSIGLQMYMSIIPHQH